MPGADEKNPGELAMRAGCGLQGDRVHAGDLDEAALQQSEDLKDALGAGVGTIGMGFRQALDAGNQLVDARVIFHSA